MPDPGRAAPAPGRVASRVPGLERVINSILVHGEDDLGLRNAPRAADQSA